MRSFRRPSGLSVFGAGALLAGLALATLSITLYPGQMTTNLLSEAVAILFEAAIVLLVADRLVARQKSREWQFTSDIVVRRAAAASVAVIRLLHIRLDDRTYGANRPRFDEFLALAQLRLSDLGSNVTALASVAEPRFYEKSRRVELQLSWLARTVARGLAGGRHPIEQTELAAAWLGLGFVKDLIATDPRGSGGSQAIVAETLGLLQERSRNSPDARSGDYIAHLRSRYSLQTEVKDNFGGGQQLGILFDMDQSLALRYFAIDWWIFSRISAN